MPGHHPVTGAALLLSLSASCFFQSTNCLQLFDLLTCLMSAPSLYCGVCVSCSPLYPQGQHSAWPRTGAKINTCGWVADWTSECDWWERSGGSRLWMDILVDIHSHSIPSLERPLHPKERVLEQALQWCQLPEPCSASLLLRKVSLAQAGCLFTGDPPSSIQHLPPQAFPPGPSTQQCRLCPGIRRESPRVGLLRCREEPPRLLGNRFQERFFLLRGRCLLLLKEKKVREAGCP